MATAVTLFCCDVCKTLYPSMPKAEECESQGLIGLVDGLKVGDFVEPAHPASAYGWHNKPDSDWTRALTEEEQRQSHHGRGRYMIRYVIANIAPGTRDVFDKHRLKYNLVCPEPPGCIEAPGPWFCWTAPSHVRIVKIEPTPAMIEWRDKHLAEWTNKRCESLM